VSRDVAAAIARPIVVVNLVYAALLLTLAIIPQPSYRPSFAASDLLVHAVAYGLQGALLAWAFVPWHGPVAGGAMAVGVVVCFGLVTECVQAVLPYRSFEAADVIADGLGAAFFASGVAVWRTRRGCTSGSR
jgi:VanZ family protein